MKTTMKIIAIAVITVLAVLSCAPEAELTSRDYGEYKEAQDPKYTNSPSGNTSFPNVTTTTLDYDTSDLAESDNEITVTIPAYSDILRESNATIENVLKTFLKFYTYTNNTSTDTDAFRPSVVNDAELPYKFIRRSGNNLIVKLTSVPNFSNIVWKIDASQYKRYGQLVDRNADGVVDAFDDRYDTISILHLSDPTVNGAFTAPLLTLTLNLYGPSATFTSGGAGTPTKGDNIYVATLTVGTGGTVAIRDKILSEELLGKVKLQKLDKTAKTWSDVGTVKYYDGTGTAPDGLFFGQVGLYANGVSREDLGIYRTKAEGVKNLTSAATYGKLPAKIYVDSSAYVLYNTVYTSEVVCYDTTIRKQGFKTSISSGGAPVIKSDAGKKNVTIEFYLNELNNSADTPAPVGLQPITTKEKFLEGARLVYRTGSTSTITNIPTNVIDLAELPIHEVTTSTSKYYDSDAGRTNCITIKLDPNYKLEGNKTIYLFLNPNFKYDSTDISFGAAALNYYDGQFHWYNYGSVLTSF